MEYKIIGQDIVFKKHDDFDAMQILECGQIFRFKKLENGEYYVNFKDNYARVFENENGEIVIHTNNPKKAIDFFDLDRDYGKIKDVLSVHEILREPIKLGHGIRILKGDPEEIIFSFIISANNNIKRIQKIIDKLCDIGEDKGGYRAFPHSREIAKASDEFFDSLHAGYRAPYLKKTAQILMNTNLEEKSKLSTSELKKWLMTLAGVGPKVASCILLFGFGRFDVFPVDTWIEKVYRDYFYVGNKSRPEIEDYFIELFGSDMSGIVQQYLFYAIREERGVKI